MLHKTLDESDKQSISTKVGPTKAASFTSTSKRQMYRNKAAINTKKVQMQISNMIVLEPEYVSFLVHDQVFFLDSAQNFVVVSDFYYGVLNDRAKPVMIARNCDPGAELLFANAKKPGMNIILYSIHRFNSPEYSTMLHFNITKYNPGEFDSIQARDIYLPISQNLNPLYFSTVQNSKKGVLLSEITNSQGQKQYQILYINLLKNNKTKNPKHSSMRKQNSLSFDHQEQKLQQNKQQKQFLYTIPQKLIEKIKLKPNQKILKMINSQFGDVILIVTNLEIYELDFEPDTIYFKPLDILQKIGKYFKKEQYQDELKDICYITDGLKIIFLTSKGVLGFIEAQNIQYAQSIHEILNNSNKKQQAAFIRVDSLVGKISVETDKGSVLIIKIGQKQLTFEKKIELPLQSNEITSYRVNFLTRHDEMILQRVTKQPKPSLQILCKNLLSPSNEFTQIYASPLDKKPQKSNNPNPIKIISSKSNTITCYLKQNTISFYKFNSSLTSSSSSSQRHPIQHLFSKTFFQKPLYISMDPYSSNIIILFKQFVKFYKFKYNDIVQYFTYDVRNVSYAGFTDSGQYILIVVQDMLYFINSFTFETDRIMEMYGDIKSVRYYDNMIYVLLKNKVNKNISETLILQTYAYEKQQYNRIHEIKIQPTEAVLTDHKFFMIASKKQIQVYRKKPQIYQQHPQKQKSPRKETPTQIQLLTSKKIQFNESTQYPTCITLSQELGIVLIGTNCGRVYQYLWPFVGEDDIENFYMVHCSTAEISRILVSATLDKMYLFCRNCVILQMELLQYIQGEEMPNIYVINPKTLYESDTLKYQFVNREYLYPSSTAYIFEDIRQTNENIEQLKFILQKTKDDIEEFVAKKTQSFQNEIKEINKEKSSEVKNIKESISSNQKKYNEQITQLKEMLVENENRYKEQVKSQKQKYEKKLLQLYKQASKLRQIYANLQKQQIRQKDLYLIENDKIIKKLKQQGEKTQEQYRQKYLEIKSKTDIFHSLQKDQMSKKIDQQLHIYNQIIRNNIEEEVNSEQQRKQSLLGSRGYLMKQINNFKQRRDEFQSLIMETNVQIQQLYADQDSYKEKRKYLMTELAQKEKIIEEKERQLISLIDSTASMKKLKQTHQFQLTEYEKQFQPIISKMTVIDGKVQKMNSQILREYLKKVEKDKQIMDNTQKFEKLKRYRQKKIKCKLDTYTKLQRFLAELQFLLQNPLDTKLQQNLNALSNGEKFQIDQQQVKQKIQNAKLMRRKTFIAKQIQQHEKRQQQVIRNKNDINRHYNQNTMLVREFNNLKQLNRKFEEMLKQTQLKFMAAKASRLETPRKKTNSMMDLKKISEKKLTPFQKHEQQYNDMFNKGLTTETKLSKTGQSMSLLKTLIKDVELTDSRYQKMEIVRDRIKSFVNPEIRIRKTLASQRVLFDRKKIQSEAEM